VLDWFPGVEDNLPDEVLDWFPGVEDTLVSKYPAVLAD